MKLWPKSLVYKEIAGAIAAELRRQVIPGTGARFGESTGSLIKGFMPAWVGSPD